MVNYSGVLGVVIFWMVLILISRFGGDLFLLFLVLGFSWIVYKLASELRNP